MAEATEEVTITVDGGHIGWEERCLHALQRRPFKFVASDDGAAEGHEFLASCSPFMGPIGFVHVGVIPNGANSTRVEVTTESEPALPTDRLMETLTRRRGWFKRGLKRSLSRLQSILEEDHDRGARATVGGL